MRASICTCPEEFLCVVKGGWLRSPPAPGCGRPQAAVLAGAQTAPRGPGSAKGLLGCQLVRAVEPNNGSDQPPCRRATSGVPLRVTAFPSDSTRWMRDGCDAKISTASAPDPASITW